MRGPASSLTTGRFSGVRSARGRTLLRVGGKYTDAWHRLHMTDPRAVVPSSIMPAYPWLAENGATRSGDIQARLRTLRDTRSLRTRDEDIDAAPAALEGKTELDALIAYLQVPRPFRERRTRSARGALT